MPQTISLYLIALKTTLICYVIPSAVSQQCSYQQGIDIFGNDLSLKFANTIEQCCNACFIDANCKAWTYVPDTQACWIKSAVGPIRQAVSQRYSGLRYGQLSSLLSNQSSAQRTNYTITQLLALLTFFLFKFFV